MTTRKLKKCKVCGTKYPPFNGLQRVCGVPCAMVEAKAKRARDDAKKAAESRRRTKRQKEAIKTKGQLIADAWAWCSRYIRERDKAEPCISCGRYDNEITEPLRGGKWDAGHWKGKGAYPELRFHQMNIHKQCKSCNGGSGKYAGKSRSVSEGYRTRLTEKIGVKMMEYFDGPESKHAQHLSHDDIREIKEHYKQLFNTIKESK